MIYLLPEVFKRHSIEDFEDSSVENIEILLGISINFIFFFSRLLVSTHSTVLSIQISEKFSIYLFEFELTKSTYYREF